MYQHALTIRNWIDELNELAWNSTDDLQRVHDEYLTNMNKLFQKLHKEIGMTKQMFSALTEQAMTL